MLNKVNYNKIAKVVIILIIVLLGAKEIYQAQKHSDKPSYVAGDGSEVNVIRGGACYARDGFFSNAGLPDIWCGGRFFPEQGGQLCGVKFTTNIYKTYPPGSHMLGGVYAKICGEYNLGCYRMFPVGLGVFSLVVFALLLLRSLTPVKAALIMLAIAVIPMTSNKMHGLQFQSYTLPLFLMYLASLIIFFKHKRRFNIRYFIFFFLFGAFQGFLSFDEVFLTTLSGIPVALLYTPLNNKEDIKRLALVVTTVSAGLFLSYALHFIQVIIYDGSAGQSYDFLKMMFKERYNDTGGGDTLEINSMKLAFEMFSQVGRSKEHFIINLPIFLGAVLLLLLIKKGVLTLTLHKPMQLCLQWASSRRNFIVILSALLISFLWIILMKQHVLFHQRYFARHFFLFYFMSILTIIENTSLLELKAPSNEENQE
ncbi:MAG: hypothetical protein C4560_07225 [Nitrospiraceae bacterium]|nr:MAG: hypothetical protein C4560_07225 [Nitrospiraceae bacterium]